MFDKILKVVLLVLAVYVVFLVLKALMRYSEAFTEQGVMMQMDSSHVPTMQDYQAAKAERREVRHDLIQMTGSP